MTGKFFVFGIENPLLDMSAVVDPSMLSKYKLKANDAILAGPEHSDLFSEMATSYKCEYLPAGAAQNSMRFAQWLLPPESTVFVGCVGKDERAEILRSAAARDGLRTEYLVDPEKPTGVCAVLITDHNRSMVTDLQAANEYKIAHLKQNWSLVEAAKYFYVGGYFLTVSPDSALALAEHACATNKVFMMNLSAPFIPQFFKQHVDALEPYWDILFGNESEALAYAQSHGWKETAIPEIAKLIANLPKKNASRPRVVVITQGIDPTVVAVQGGEVKEYPILPVEKSKIVDTTGAGDAFAGGFIAMYAQEKSLEECIAAGQYTASVVVQHSGPSFPREPHQFKRTRV